MLICCIWSCLPFEQPNQTPQLPICSLCAVQNNVSCSFWDQLLPEDHVPADNCDKEWTLVEDHPWSMATTERIEVFSPCPPFLSFLPWLAPTGFIWGTFLQNLKGSGGSLRERERFWWRSFSLRLGNATRPGVSMWQDGPCSFFPCS